MRIQLTFVCDTLRLPLNYQHMIQGLIYSAFDRSKSGDFFHNQGYRLSNKVFKMFVFSNLFGEYNIQNKQIVFKDKVTFYISSYSEEFLKTIYDFFNQNEKVVLNKQFITLSSIKFIDTPYFKGQKELVLHSLSPIVTYQTQDNYVSYFKPSDHEFELLCLQNLKDKCEALGRNLESIEFKCKKINYEKKRLVKFKNTFYIGYLSEIIVEVNYETLCLLMDTGISAKGPAGFGMIEIKNT